MEAKSPACPKCQAPIEAGLLNRGNLSPCPACGSLVSFEIFPAWFRPPGKGSLGDPALLGTEACCFYHPEKQAVLVCDSCGRFLCALCDCPIHQRHLCPPCLESRQKKGGIEDLETTRNLYGRQAFILAILPLFITGLLSLYIALRYRKIPGSIVRPRPWLMPAAVVIASIQVIAFAVLFLVALFG